MVDTNLQSLEKMLNSSPKTVGIILVILSLYVMYYIAPSFLKTHMIAGIPTKIILVSVIGLIAYKYPSYGLIAAILILGYALAMNDTEQPDVAVFEDSDISPTSKDIIKSSMDKATILTSMVKKASDEGNSTLAEALTNEVAKQDIKIDSVIKASKFNKASEDASRKGDHETAQQYKNEANKNEIKLTALVNSEILRTQAQTATEQGEHNTAHILTKAAETEETKVKLILHADDSLAKAVDANNKGNIDEANAHLENVNNISNMLVKLTEAPTTMPVSTTVPTSSETATPTHCQSIAATLAANNIPVITEAPSKNNQQPLSTEVSGFSSNDSSWASI